MEAPSGFEPLDEGFADPSLNHLGTAPWEVRYYLWGAVRFGSLSTRLGRFQMERTLFAYPLPNPLPNPLPRGRERELCLLTLTLTLSLGEGRGNEAMRLSSYSRA